MLHLKRSISSDSRSINLFLLSVFATYHLPKRKKSAQFLGLSTLYFEVQYKNKHIKIPLNEIAKVLLEKRRKLAPLIIGGIITSLSLLSILLFSSGLEVVGLAALGLLLTYYGMQEYLVVHLEHANNTQLIWLPGKVEVATIRPFIALLEYYISRQHFPLLFARSAGNDSRLVHFENKPEAAQNPIYYSFTNKQLTDYQLIAVNPALLDAPISIYADKSIIGQGDFLINSKAVVENNTVSYS